MVSTMWTAQAECLNDVNENGLCDEVESDGLYQPAGLQL